MPKKHTKLSMSVFDIQHSLWLKGVSKITGNKINFCLQVQFSVETQNSVH